MLRRLVRDGAVSAHRANQAIEDLRLAKVRSVTFRGELLADVIPPQVIATLAVIEQTDDTAYIALAEKLRAPLLTRDGRLASASGHTALIELF